MGEILDKPFLRLGLVSGFIQVVPAAALAAAPKLAARCRGNV